MTEKPNNRMDKVEREVRALLSSFFVKELPFHTDTLVSLATIKITKDLRNANVYISVLGEKEEQEESLDLVKSLRKDMQTHLSKNLRTKYIPKLQFFLDDTYAENFRIMDKLKDLGFENNVNDFLEE